MKAPVLFTTLALSFLAFGCTKAPTEQAQGQQAAAKEKEGNECEGCVDSMTTVVTKSDADMSKGFTLTDYTPISKILADFPAFEGKRVLIKGEAVSLCAKRGCFVNLKSDQGEGKMLRVKVEDGVIVFPVEVKGHEVIAEGIVEKVIIPVETLRDALKKAAEAKGEAFDPTSVTEARTIWQMHGIAAKCPEAKWES